MNWTDTIILGFYNNSKDIGVYSICLKMAMSSSIVLFSINSIAAPKFSELYSSNKIIDFEKVVKLSSKMIFWLSPPILLLIALKAEFLLKYEKQIWPGEKDNGYGFYIEVLNKY